MNGNNGNGARAIMGEIVDADACDIVTMAKPEIIKRLMSANMHALVPLVDLVQRALCGKDPSAYKALDRAAKSCGCGGCGNVRRAVLEGYNQGVGGPSTSTRWIVSQGQSGFRGHNVTHWYPKKDWNCRTDLGDVDACQIAELKADPYPVVVAPMSSVSNTTGLPPVPAGYAWFELGLVPGFTGSCKISMQICVESFRITDGAGAMVQPLRFALQGEILVCGDDGEAEHAADYPKFTARNGWQITDERCRCLEPPCVKLPASARSRFLALLPFVGTYTADVEIFRDPELLGSSWTELGCGDELQKRCGRLVVSSCNCDDCYMGNPPPTPPPPPPAVPPVAPLPEGP